MKTKYPVFSKTIFVHWEDPQNGDPYMEIGEGYAEFAIPGEKIKVAIYKLEKVVTVEAEPKLVE